MTLGVAMTPPPPPRGFISISCRAIPSGSPPSDAHPKGPLILVLDRLLFACALGTLLQLGFEIFGHLLERKELLQCPVLRGTARFVRLG